MKFNVLNRFIIKASRQLVYNKALLSSPANGQNNTNLNGRVTSVVTGKLGLWLQLYEDVVGLTEVREAQEKVIQVSKYNFTLCVIKFGVNGIWYIGVFSSCV